MGIMLLVCTISLIRIFSIKSHFTQAGFFVCDRQAPYWVDDASFVT